ncbi:unnamed protein product [Ectocarpus sp. 8 AP-2014]
MFFAKTDCPGAEVGLIHAVLAMFAHPTSLCDCTEGRQNPDGRVNYRIKREQPPRMNE